MPFESQITCECSKMILSLCGIQGEPGLDGHKGRKGPSGQPGNDGAPGDSGPSGSSVCCAVYNIISKDTHVVCVHAYILGFRWYSWS